MRDDGYSATAVVFVGLVVDCPVVWGAVTPSAIVAALCHPVLKHSEDHEQVNTTSFDLAPRVNRHWCSAPHGEEQERCSRAVAQLPPFGRPSLLRQPVPGAFRGSRPRDHAPKLRVSFVFLSCLSATILTLNRTSSCSTCPAFLHAPVVSC